MICDITSHLEPILVQYSGYTNEKWKLEAFDVQKTLNGRYSEGGDILCPARKTLEINTNSLFLVEKWCQMLNITLSKLFYVSSNMSGGNL